MEKEIVIVGAGAAGITVAARLQTLLGKACKIQIIDPASKHFYQPMWSLVGTGVFPYEKSEKEWKR